MIGHSFGGLILFNAISEALIEGLTYRDDGGDRDAPAVRFGDMVILLNPAFEASRYTPLHRIATNPIRPFVKVSSTNSRFDNVNRRLGDRFGFSGGPVLQHPL